MTSAVSKPRPKKTESRKVKKARKTREAQQARDAEETRLAARKAAAAALVKPEAAPAGDEPAVQDVAAEAELVAPVRPGRAIISSGLLTMVALASLGVVRLLHQSLINHYYGDQARYGQVALLISIATITSLALPAGVASAMSKFIPFHRGSGSEPAARAVYRFLSRIGLAGSLFFGVAVGFLIPFFKPEIGPRDAILVGLLTFTFSTYSFDKAAMYGFDRVRPYTMVEISTGLLTIGITVALLVTRWDAFLLPLVVGYALFSLVSRWLLRRDLAGETAPATAINRREILTFVALACAGTLASTGFLNGTNVLADIFGGDPQAVGYFGSAVALMAPMNLLPRALNLALFPAMAHAQGAGDTDAVRRHSDISTRALFVVLAPVFAAAIPLAQVILIVFGKNAEAGTTVLQIMLGATFLSVVQVASVNALSSGTLRQVRIPVISAVTGAVIGVALSPLMALWLGAPGIGIAYLAGTTVIAGGPIVVTWRLHRMHWTGMVIRSLSVVALAGVAAGVIDAMGLTTGFTGVATAVGAAVVVFAIAIVVLWPELRKLIAVARRRGSF
ncbi:lipopolysaccharide biosynthesis protein [Fodinicola acaciae]|uniref:lipopolysaccharide biosynthesis protein n=1 Tax=Fodinicola acaciae TaxID=2681555 RepID=UPI0013D298FB|nr:lipopolysaccharide biosynthesis protein [Fodinicola acaciae]